MEVWDGVERCAIYLAITRLMIKSAVNSFPIVDMDEQDQGL